MPLPAAPPPARVAIPPDIFPALKLAEHLSTTLFVPKPSRIAFVYTK